MSRGRISEQFADDIEVDDCSGSAAFNTAYGSELKAGLARFMSKPVQLVEDVEPVEPTTTPEIMERYKKLTVSGADLSREQVMERNAALKLADPELYDYMDQLREYVSAKLAWNARAGMVRNAVNTQALAIINGGVNAGMEAVKGGVANALVYEFENRLKKAAGE